MYAIGGSAAPTINSQGNRFLAPDTRFSKEVCVARDMYIYNTLENTYIISPSQENQNLIHKYIKSIKILII